MSSGRSLRARPATAPAPARRQPTARQLENREMQRRRRETPVAEANRVYRIYRQLCLNHGSYDNAVENYNHSGANARTQLYRLTPASPMRRYYETLLHKLNQGRPSFINAARNRFQPKSNENLAANLNANLRRMTTRSVPWTNMKNGDPVGLVDPWEWPGNIAFVTKRAGAPNPNFFTPASFTRWFTNWRTVTNPGNRYAKTHPLNRSIVYRKNVNVVRLTGNKPKKPGSPRVNKKRSPNKKHSPSGSPKRARSRSANRH